MRLIALDALSASSLGSSRIGDCPRVLWCCLALGLSASYFPAWPFETDRQFYLFPACRREVSGRSAAVKILLTAAQFSSNISGLQRHAFNVVRCLLKQRQISSVHFVIAPWQRELVREAGLHSMDRVTLHVADMSRSILSRNLWYYYRLPELAAQIQPDVVHLSYPVPVNSSAISCPTVVTLHDLYPYEIPGNFGFPKVFFNRFILQQCLRNVDAVACVSDATVLRMKQYIPTPIWGKAIRIYNCVETEPARAEESPLPNWHSDPFLLSVSQHRKNKNIPLLIRVFHRLLHHRLIHEDMKLV